MTGISRLAPGWDLRSRPWRPGFSRSPATGRSAGFAIGLRSRSNLTSRGCRLRSRRSLITNGRSTWTGSGDAARSGVRAGPHVHVVVFHLRMDFAAGGDGRVARVDSPGLALLVAFALPTVFTSTWRPGVERDVQERADRGQPTGAASVQYGNDGASGKGSAGYWDRRCSWRGSGGTRGSDGIGQWLARDGEPRCGIRWHGRSSGRDMWARWFSWPMVLKATPGQVLLVLAAGARLSAYIGATVGEIGFLRGFWLDGSRRMAWLEDYAASLMEHADSPAPERLLEGIRFEHVSFTYPGTEKRCWTMSMWS